MSTETVEHDSEQRTSILGGEIARRGMTALSLPVGEAELSRYVAAVGEFAHARGVLLRDAA